MKKCIISEKNCCVCFQLQKKMRSLHEAQEEGDETPNEMLQLLIGHEVFILKDSSIIAMPERICRDCELLLNLCHQFRLKVLKAKNILDKYYKERQQNVSIVKEEEYEVSEGNEPLTTLIEIAPVDIVELNKRSHNNAEKLSTDVDTSINGIEDGELSENDKAAEDVNHSQVLAVPSDKETLILSDIVVPESSATPNVIKKSHRKPTTNINSLSRQNEIKKVHINKGNGYICDICGNVFSKRGRLTEHRRKHGKESQYICELCDKGFNIREHLRRHMFLHQGKRPFKCQHCSRTFFYESVKKSHEAVHEGYKPYVCTISSCNKAFAYSHSLKKHQLIHSNEKYYHCDLCDKDFRLQHHMKQHLETRCHKMAEALFNKTTEKSERVLQK